MAALDRMRRSPDTEEAPPAVGVIRTLKFVPGVREPVSQAKTPLAKGKAAAPGIVFQLPPPLLEYSSSTLSLDCHAPCVHQ